LGFISSLPQLAWEKGFDVVVVVVKIPKLRENPNHGVLEAKGLVWFGIFNHMRIGESMRIGER
jgi:hypothetical protein